MSNQRTNKCTSIDVKFSDHHMIVDSGSITPYDVMKKFDIDNLKSVLVALVNNEPWDLHRPLEESCEVIPCDFDHPVGYKTFMHSSAHVLGEALEECFPGVHLCDGPPLHKSAHGPSFFYDCVLPVETHLSSDKIQQVVAIMKRIIRENQSFERATISRDQARQLFANNPVKLALLEKIATSETVSVYRCGSLVDLCRGPHIARTGLIKSFDVVGSSASGTTLTHSNESLPTQRVYGIAFPKKHLLSEWKRVRKLAKERDHRIILSDQRMTMFHPSAPGSAFFLPHGTRLYNTLKSFIRKEYRRRGYEEVITPLVYDRSLWEQSGHWQHYHEHMFLWTENDEHLGLKPMNCPGHCVMYASSLHSYRDLPLRFADFSSLHRNELSGALTGLTRVRRFCQDDAHIFCTEGQLMNELRDCMDMVEHVYRVLGMRFRVTLSTRPSHFMGDVKLWDSAEKSLREAVAHVPYTVNEGDGAFYGPKLDVYVEDVLGREHQCATIQLDFQLPRRFQLTYKGSDGEFHTPVMVHRAILGSFERCIAIITEHTAGKWPLWLNPRQIIVLPVADKHIEYATTVAKNWRQDWYVDVDSTSDTLPKKIKRAQSQRYNYMVIVGDQEVQAQNITVRSRDDGDLGATTVNEFTTALHEEVTATTTR